MQREITDVEKDNESIITKNQPKHKKKTKIIIQNLEFI